MTEEIKKELEDEAYYSLKEIPGRGICGLSNLLFTVGLFYNITDGGIYEGRYCFPSVISAAIALHLWDGVGDPAGPWIKHKGLIEYSNPNNLSPYDRQRVQENQAAHDSH